MSLDPKKRTDAPQEVVQIAKVKGPAELQKELDAANARVAELEALLKKHKIAF